MKSLIIVLLLASMAGAGCSSTKLTGTAYSVTFRPSDSDTSSIVGTRNLSLVNSRTGAVISSADYDRRQKWYFFKLPLQTQLANHESICLALKSYNGTVPLRKERRTDDGYDFRNPLWEAEVRRSANIQRLRAELSRIDDDELLARTELEALERKYGETVAHGRSPCPLMERASLPPKPAAALDEAAAKSAAAGVCAMKWQSELGADARSLFNDAGLLEEWNGRAAAEAVARAMDALKLALSTSDTELIRVAMIEGALDVRHARGIAAFKSKQSDCKGRVITYARQVLQAWNEQSERMALAPTLAKQRCEADVRKVPVLKARLTEATAPKAALRKKIAGLEEAEPSATESAALDSNKCRL